MLSSVRLTQVCWVEGEVPAGEAAQAPQQALPSTPSKASGLTQYRAPTAPLQRSKLESFDRKIGRATNSLKVSSSGIHYRGVLCRYPAGMTL